MLNEKASAQAVNGLFSFLSSLESLVFWIRSADYQKQLYISQAYEAIWGRSCDDLREHPMSWQETLVFDDLQRNMSEFYRRMDISGGSTMAFRIHRPDGTMRWIKDTSYTLTNKEGSPILIAGVGENISAEQWQVYCQNEQQPKDSKSNGLAEFLEVIQTEYKLLINSSQPTIAKVETSLISQLEIDGQNIHLHKRESQCLHYLLQGLSAKQTADVLHISPRTVETYLENLRKKTRCRSKLALISKITANLKHAN